MINASIQQEDITLIDIHALNIGAHKYIKQIQTQRERTIALHQH